jgi:hypothetical protein
MALSYDRSKDIATFNGRFKDLKMTLQDAGLDMQAIFYIHQYLKNVTSAFPTWAERQRSILRAINMVTSMPTDAMLDDMMADLIDENRALSAQYKNGNNTSMYGNGPHSQKHEGNPEKSNTNTDRYCSHCNKAGHLEQNCYIKHREEKEESPKRCPKNENSKNSNSNSDFKSPQISIMADKPVTPRNIKPSDWILGTAASHHMCNDRTMFDGYRRNTNPANTIFTSGSTTRAEGYGTVTITAVRSDNSTAVIILHNVVHMPSLKVNVLSGPIIMAKGMYIDGFTKTIRSRSDKSELCKFQALNSAMRICTTLTSNALLAATQSIDIWHQRLGHIGYDNVRKTAQITTGIKISNSKDCPKPACEPYISSTAVDSESKQPQKRCEHAFDKINVDIIGPITPVGINGSVWAMVLTDEYSGVRWLYTFKNKGEAQNRMTEFATGVHTEYGKYPKAICLRNCAEYLGEPLKRFCWKRGVCIETTAQDTLEQEIILERTRMITKGLDNDSLKKLWPEFMRTAVYLANRTPTGSLQDKTPFEALRIDIGRPEVPNLSHLRIIGCKAYYYIAKEYRQKGADRAKQGILVGYEGNSIYRIYNAEEGVIRASSVEFDENDAPNTH